MCVSIETFFFYGIRNNTSIKIFPVLNCLELYSSRNDCRDTSTNRSRYPSLDGVPPPPLPGRPSALSMVASEISSHPLFVPCHAGHTDKDRPLITSKHGGPEGRLSRKGGKPEDGESNRQDVWRTLLTAEYPIGDKLPW